MLNNAIARRYAQAFFAIAEENNQVDRFEEELTIIADVINQNNELKKIINHELISSQIKKETMAKIFSGQVSEITMNFLDLLVDKHRETLIPEIIEEFISDANEARNIQEAEITSAFELAEKDVQEIKNKLASFTGKNIRLTVKVNSDLIGGLVVRIGDKVIDSSVLAHLQGLKSKLKQNLS